LITPLLAKCSHRVIDNDHLIGGDNDHVLQCGTTDRYRCKVVRKFTRSVRMISGIMVPSVYRLRCTRRIVVCRTRHASHRKRTIVTEIPEHLLKRSRERRSALGLGDEGASTESSGDAPAPASTTPATVESASATPAPSGPAPRAAVAAGGDAPAEPAMVHPTVVAAKRRRKIPFWAMAALSLMPVWAFMYARALTQTAEVSAGPVGIGAEIYGNCSSCHGGAGGGGVGYAFTGGEILKSYPNIEDMIRYVYFGTSPYQVAGIEVPGDPNREGGPHTTGALGGMPGFGATVGGGLSDAELLAVVCHERYTLGGADPTSDEWADEYATWCSVESPVYNGIESGAFGLADAEMFVDGIIPIGTEPIPGRTAGDR